MLVACLALGALCSPSPAQAHFGSIGYSRITSEGPDVVWRLWLDPYHLRTLVPIDEDGDGTVLAGEVSSAQTMIRQLITPGLRVGSDSGARPTPSLSAPTLTTVGETGLKGDGVTDITDFPLVQVDARFRFADPPHGLTMAYDLFLQKGFGDHANVAEVALAGRSGRHTFTVASASLTAASLPAAVEAPSSSRSTSGFVLPLAIPALVAVLFIAGGGAALLSRRHVKESIS